MRPWESTSCSSPRSSRRAVASVSRACSRCSPGTCPAKAGYGVMFHFKDASNYYLLTIFCDNTYTAVAKVAGSVQAMNYGNLPSGLDAKAKCE